MITEPRSIVFYPPKPRTTERQPGTSAATEWRAANPERARANQVRAQNKQTAKRILARRKSDNSRRGWKYRDAMRMLRRGKSVADVAMSLSTPVSNVSKWAEELNECQD